MPFSGNKQGVSSLTAVQTKNRCAFFVLFLKKSIISMESLPRALLLFC